MSQHDLTPQSLYQQLLEFVKSVDTDSIIEPQTLQSLQTSPHYDSLIEQLILLATSESKSMALNIDSLLKSHEHMIYFQQIYSQQKQGYLPAEAPTLSNCFRFCEVIISIIEFRPSVVKKNKNRAICVVERLFTLFCKLDISVTEQWMKPEQGYSLDEDFSEENTLTKQMLSFFDKLANAYSYQMLVALLVELIPGWQMSGLSLTGSQHGMISNSSTDFKTPYVLLMIMSQLGEDNHEPMQIMSFVEFAIKNSTHEHPKVRFAVLQMFGQISDDMKPSFQEVYGEQVLPVIQNLSQDPVSRVRGHALACWTNFLEDFEIKNFNILQPFLPQIIATCSESALSGDSTTKQNAVSALASIGTITMIGSEEMQAILETINNVLTMPLHENFIYNQLINQSMECLTIVMMSQKHHGVQKYLQYAVSSFKKLMHRLSKNYLCGAWSRLCIGFGRFMPLQEDNVFEFILKSVIKMVGDNEDECETGVDAIINTIEAYQSEVRPLASAIIQFVTESLLKLEIGIQDDIRSKLFEVVDSLISKLKSEAPDPEWEKVCKELLIFLVNQITSMVGVDCQLSNYQGLEEALKGPQMLVSHLSNSFDLQTIDQFIKTIMEITQKINNGISQFRHSMKEFQESLNNNQFEDLEFEEIQTSMNSSSESLKQLEEARLIIPDIFQEVLKLSSLDPQKQREIIEMIHQHIGPFLDVNEPPQNQRYAVYFMCDLLDLGYQLIQPYAPIYEEMLCKFSVSEEVLLRNASVYGLGIYMEKVPIQKIETQKQPTKENIETKIYTWLSTAKKSLDISDNSDLSKREMNFARDNVVSAIGRLLKSKAGAFPHLIDESVFKKWFSYLPLNTDKEEGNVQHLYMVHFCQTQIELILGNPQKLVSNQQDLLWLMRVIAKYFQKRKKKAFEPSASSEIVTQNKLKTVQALQMIKNWPLFKESEDYIWQSLADHERSTLLNLTQNS